MCVHHYRLFPTGLSLLSNASFIELLVIRYDHIRVLFPAIKMSILLAILQIKFSLEHKKDTKRENKKIKP